MMKKTCRLLLLFLLAVPGFAAEDDITFNEEEIALLTTFISQPEPLPDPSNRYARDPKAIAFGKTLFFDKRLSEKGDMACSTCHDPAKGWGDGLEFPEGSLTQRNTPTILNAAYNRWFFWAGRADSLWSQALQPMESPVEQRFTRLELVHLLAGDANYKKQYEAIFGALPDVSGLPKKGRPTGDADHSHDRAWRSLSQEDQDAVNRVFGNIGKSLAAFEMGVHSRKSNFDVFVEGLKDKDPVKQKALSESAKLGLKIFLYKGRCNMCHLGPTFSDGEFHNILVPRKDRQPTKDTGRYAGIKNLAADPFNSIGAYSDHPEKDQLMTGYLVASQINWGQFRTPSLRDVARTAPYMHQGQFATLRDVIDYYSTLEDAVTPGGHNETILIPLNLIEEEKQALIDFLTSLNSISDPRNFALNAGEKRSDP